MAYSETYVDPSIAANTGSGTIGDPYGDLQHALNSVTRDGTNGDRFNVKAGTAELLSTALVLTTYGTPSFNAPLIFQGYTSTQGDGGLGTIDCQANAISVLTQTGSAIHWYDMELRNNSGANNLLNMNQYGAVQRCYLHNCGQTAINCATGANNCISDCRIENCNTYGVWMSNFCTVWGCYFANGTNKFTYAVANGSPGSTIWGNFFNLDGASYGIQWATPWGGICAHNSILSSSGTAAGIQVASGGQLGNMVMNNIVEGFSGTGGRGIQTMASNGTRPFANFSGNAVYNNANNYNTNHFSNGIEEDNEVLSGSAFAKSGSNNFANRWGYYGPVDPGGSNVLTGGYPSGSGRTKGAVQAAGSGAARGSLLKGLM